jgi:hypothetical protein
MSMSELSTKRDAPQTPQQLRRSILQAAKERVIDRYRPSSGVVTSLMRGTAKAGIEHELATLPLEELPFEEVCEFAAAIRDRCYIPSFTRQAREAARQDAECQTRRRKELEEMAALHRADHRKTSLIEQAMGQARARCEAQQIIGRGRLRVFVEIESRLQEFLTGHESDPDVHAIIQSVLAARFSEAELQQTAAQTKADERWYEELTGLLLVVALLAAPVLALKYPTHMLAILNWIERICGLTPGAEATAPTRAASETTPPTANTDSRPPSTRRQKDPVSPSGPASPWEHSIGTERGHA